MRLSSETATASTETLPLPKASSSATLPSSDNPPPYSSPTEGSIDEPVITLFPQAITFMTNGKNETYSLLTPCGEQAAPWDDEKKLLTFRDSILDFKVSALAPGNRKGEIAWEATRTHLFNLRSAIQLFAELKGVKVELAMPENIEVPEPWKSASWKSLGEKEPTHASIVSRFFDPSKDHPIPETLPKLKNHLATIRPCMYVLASLTDDPQSHSAQPLLQPGDLYNGISLPPPTEGTS